MPNSRPHPFEINLALATEPYAYIAPSSLPKPNSVNLKSDLVGEDLCSVYGIEEFNSCPCTMPIWYVLSHWSIHKVLFSLAICLEHDYHIDHYVWQTKAWPSLRVTQNQWRFILSKGWIVKTKAYTCVESWHMAGYTLADWEFTHLRKERVKIVAIMQNTEMVTPT